MKKSMDKKTLGMSLASFLILLLFLILAGGSIVKDLLSQYYLPDIERKSLDDGRIQEIHEYSDSYMCEEMKWHYKVTGYYDTHMRWHGLMRIEKIEEDHGIENLVYTEEVMMVHGKRDGLATTTHRDGRITHKIYNMGYEVEDLKKGQKGSQEVTAFYLLDDQYSWQQEMFNDAGYDDIFLKDLLDTFEILLGGYEFGPEAFDSIYGEVEDRLDDTRFDTLLRYNSNFFSFVNGMELLKDAEFRMAVIDQYSEDKSTLFEVIQNTYPGYLASLEPEGVIEVDFMRFCQSFDSCMNSYGPFDKTDPVNFIDSVDTRIYRALTGIYTSGHSEVAEVVLNDMLFRYVQGNIIHQCVRKAWTVNEGVILLPTVTTSFEGSISASSAEFTGFVLEDGGAPVTSRGVVWAEHYDPALQDSVKSSGSGTGSFTLEVGGLEDGKTYYARAYAANVAGISYGNCISFMATSSSGPQHSLFPENEIRLFPNPASDEIFMNIRGPLSADARIAILQLNGQVVYQEKVAKLIRETGRFRLNLSALSCGTYICHLQDQGRVIATEKLIIIK